MRILCAESLHCCSRPRRVSTSSCYTLCESAWACYEHASTFTISWWVWGGAWLCCFRAVYETSYSLCSHRLCQSSRVSGLGCFDRRPACGVVVWRQHTGDKKRTAERALDLAGSSPSTKVSDCWEHLLTCTCVAALLPCCTLRTGAVLPNSTL